ncbi:FUSC family protein [Agathobaculum sp. Marseille-P7918]|uniref:FUSC family protein n=1 Tax=Agathobaculum sp. Marseille-P7918 TaxID=2479843 RepID=UPI000F63A362|nr:FUSC family protein [Agathobaculum sp. Marseille-P7918]
MSDGIARGWRTFWAALRRALPIILFFLSSFAIVSALAGLQYVIVVSVVTVFFQTRYKRQDNTAIRYLRLLLVGSALMVLGFIAAGSLAACIVLNLCVPFVLVLTQSSQFKPKGYFTYAMLFVFLSLIPPANTTEMFIELVVFWLGVCYLAGAIALYGRLFRRPVDVPLTLERALVEMSELLLLLIEPDRQKELNERFRALLHTLHQMSYHQHFFSRQTPDNQLYDMVSTLAQRFSYLITDHEWRTELDEARVRMLRQLAAFLRDVSASLANGTEDEQIDRARTMLDCMDIPEGRVRIFSRSLLHMLVLLLRTHGQPVTAAVYPVSWGGLLQQLRLRLTTESFELRFAMRLATVLTVSNVISFVLPVTHSYWIPLNAFLLLQPSCEDSSYRMKTRPIGTLIGCVIEFILHPLLPGLGGQLVFALVMISLMYCATPGTWYHPIFSTCYALTLATMTLNEATAVTLRLVYLGAAVAIVFVVNRFFFPIRKEAMFRYNIKALFRLHNSYWEFIRRGLAGDTDLSVSCEILTCFHMLYEECVGYVTQHPALPHREDLQTVLLTLWHMFSELEQMHYLIRTQSVRPEEADALLEMIDAIEEELYPIIDGRNFPALRRRLHYRESGVNYVVTQYLRHAESLLQYKACIPF